MAQEYPADEARPRRRGRKLLIGLIVLLLVVAGLLVVGRPGGGRGGRAAHRRPGQPGGRQAGRAVRRARGRGRRASRSSPRCSTAGTSGSPSSCATCRPRSRVTRCDCRVLDVDARNVRASLDTLRTGQGDVVAETVNGTGTINYDSLAAAARPARAQARRAGRQARRHRAGRHPRPEVHRRRHRRRHGRQERRGRAALQRPDAEGLPNAAAGPHRCSTTTPRASRSTCPLPELPFQLAVRKVEPQPGGPGGHRRREERADQLRQLTARRHAGGFPDAWSARVASPVTAGRLRAHGDPPHQTARGRPVPRGHLPVSPRHLTAGLSPAA